MPQSSRLPWYRILYIQVIISVLLGVAFGYTFPGHAKYLQPLGDGFIKLIKMMIAPIIFCTVVHGIASAGDLRKLGRVGIKALLYFEVVSTIALVIGLVVVNVLQPGVGITPPGETYHAEASALQETQKISAKAHSLNLADFILNIIPSTILGAFVSGDLLQVLFVSILIAFAVVGLGERGKPALDWIEEAGKVFFSVMQIVVRAAPIGAFGAMGYTVGVHGIGTLNKLLILMSGFYLTAALFVFVVLGSITWLCGISIFRFLAYIKDELLLVLGTSSSETALPSLMDKMQRLGCSKSTVGIVVPTGYSFNLDGTNIYMSMAAIFLAQATNTPLDLAAQIKLLVIAMLTSKGASGVTGAGFVALAATLEVVPSIPMGSLALLVGIDRFMSECRAITNFIGNAVAALAISRWENEEL
ncbi:MAG: C4-dicarboxylate transporter DctA, partial [Pirellula sp.]